MKTFEQCCEEVATKFSENGGKIYHLYLKWYGNNLAKSIYKEAAELYADERVKEERGKIAQYIMERYDIIPNSIDMRELSDKIKNRKP